MAPNTCAPLHMAGLGLSVTMMCLWHMATLGLRCWHLFFVAQRYIVAASTCALRQRAEEGLSKGAISPNEGLCPGAEVLAAPRQLYAEHGCEPARALISWKPLREGRHKGRAGALI